MIVITGGAGFIGSNLLAGLAERHPGRPVAVVDRLGDGEKWRNIARRELAALIAPEDLFAFLDAHRGVVETMFHLGAVSSTEARDGDLLARDNFMLSLRLWDWCAQHGVRLIYASSAATYGDGSAGFDDDSKPAALAALRPLNPYGWSKHLFDRRIARIAAEGGWAPPQWAGLKFFNVYGPNEYHKGSQQSAVIAIHARVAAGAPAVLFRSHHPDYEDGAQSRDFIWVGDCVEVMLWLYDSPSVCGILNVGTGRARSFADLAAAVHRAHGVATRIDYVDTPEHLRDRYQYFTEARLKRLRAAGYRRAFTALEDGVGRYVRDFLAAPDRYR